jgi:hypothetical protein
MLHLSERTLQRYAKNNSSFEGIYTDRILLLQEMINLGLETFTDADAFYRWLKKDKLVLGQTLNFESLYSDSGYTGNYRPANQDTIRCLLHDPLPFCTQKIRP